MAADLKWLRGNAQRRVDEICRLLLDDEDSLAVQMAAAQRLGLSQATVDDVFATLRRLVIEAEITTGALAAIEPPRMKSHRVVL